MPPDLTYRAMLWRNGRDTGMSSVALVSYLMGWPIPDELVGESRRTPRDPADLGRCIRALDALPELRARLQEARGISPQWAALIDAWDEVERLYRLEAPTGSAPLCYARMKQLLDVWCDSCGNAEYLWEGEASAHCPGCGASSARRDPRVVARVYNVAGERR